MSKHAQEDAVCGDRIEAIFERSRMTYGRLQVHAQLRSEGVLSSPRVLDVSCGNAVYKGITRRRRYARSDRTNLLTPDLVDRKFTALAPNQLWLADITYVPAGTTFLFLAVVLDAFSRRIVGWAMENHLRTELVLKALDMAIYRRLPSNVAHHSDQGTQYTSVEFGLRASKRRCGLRWELSAIAMTTQCARASSRRSNASCWGGAISRTEAERAIFEFIEGWYNPHGRHSSLATSRRPPSSGRPHSRPPCQIPNRPPNRDNLNLPTKPGHLQGDTSISP
jgi:putative transposase